MRLFLTIISLFLINLSFSFGQTRLTGTITEQDNTPIIGAVVTLSSNASEKNTVTDVNGSFQFADLEDTYNKFIVRSLGFKTYEQMLRRCEKFSVSVHHIHPC